MNDAPIYLDDKTATQSARALPSVVVIGNFDGVHRGHQSVFVEAIREARMRNVPPCVLTFLPHPSAVLGRGEPAQLTSLNRKVELILRTGIESVYVRKFDPEFASSSPERFARDLLASTLKCKLVVVGDNFRFGSGRAGDRADLEELGKGLGFETYVHGVASDSKGAFSSTRVRRAIESGSIDEASDVLGRFHSISGTVVHGAHQGRSIGFPTANLDGICELLPPNGVYAVVVDELIASDSSGRTSLALAKGAMNIGIRPTMASSGQTLARQIEVHLFDLNRDLYGKELRVHIVKRLREEKKFEGIDLLKVQVAEDIQAARQLLHGIKPEDGAFG